MTAPSEVVNASPPGPVNWHLRCVLRIGWLGFPRVGKLYTVTFRFQESNDQSCCKTEAFALTTGLVVLFPQARLSSITAREPCHRNTRTTAAPAPSKSRDRHYPSDSGKTVTGLLVASP